MLLINHNGCVYTLWIKHRLQLCNQQAAALSRKKIRRNTEYGIISHTNTVYQWSGRNKVGKSTAAVQTAQLWYDGSKCSRHVIICLVIQMFLLSVVYNTAVIFFPFLSAAISSLMLVHLLHATLVWTAFLWEIPRCLGSVSVLYLKQQ